MGKWNWKRQHLSCPSMPKGPKRARLVAVNDGYQVLLPSPCFSKFMSKKSYTNTHSLPIMLKRVPDAPHPLVQGCVSERGNEERVVGVGRGGGGS